jgi:hypothetical protein
MTSVFILNVIVSNIVIKTRTKNSNLRGKAAAMREVENGLKKNYKKQEP